MTEQNVIALKEKLLALGFEKLASEIDFGEANHLESFTVFHYNETSQDQLMYALRFQKNLEDEVILKEYVLGIRHIPIPEVTITGINTRELEDKMIKADELYKQYLNGNKDTSQNYLIGEATDELMKLLNSGETGKEMAQVIMFKYWPEEEWERFIEDETPLRLNYETKLFVSLNEGDMLTAMEAFEKIKQTYSVPIIEGMGKEHVISDEAIEWAQFELSNNRNWIAYNTIPYFLEKTDMQFFKSKDEAVEFSDNNISEYDDFKVIYGRSIQDVLKQIPYGITTEKEINNLITKNLSIMNQENLNYLKDNIKYLGFGDKLFAELESNLKKGKDEFSLSISTMFQKDTISAVLHFKKSDSTDMYFFNKYDAKLEKPGKEAVEQTIYLDKGKGITMKEAYNLLDGRAVYKELTNKEDQKYHTWLQLDFNAKDKNNNFEMSRYHENYGYDLKEVLSYYPVKEMANEEDKEKLIRSLEKGNRQSVTLETEGGEIKVFMEADPKYKTLNLTGTNGMDLSKEQKEELMIKPEMKEQANNQKQEKENKQELDKEGQPEKKQGKGVKKNSSGEEGLLPKKRNGNKKGLSV